MNCCNEILAWIPGRQPCGIPGEISGRFPGRTPEEVPGWINGVIPGEISERNPGVISGRIHDGVAGKISDWSCWGYWWNNCSYHL